MSGNIRVLIADDHPVVRNGLAAALSLHDDIQVVGEAADGLAAEAMSLELKPDIIIMDCYMPGRNGLEAMKAIKQRQPKVKVLFLTVSEKDDDLIQAMRSGADGYLLKGSRLEKLVEAVRSVSQGEAVLSAQMTIRLLNLIPTDRNEPVLSGREKEILKLVGEGMTTDAIAHRLFLSPNTVSSYVRRIMEKLNLNNRAEMVAYSINHKKGQPV